MGYIKKSERIKHFWRHKCEKSKLIIMCPVCGKKFTTKSKCEGHIIQRHDYANLEIEGFNLETSSNMCTQCGDDFPHPSLLATHEYSHKMIKYNCKKRKC